MLPFCISLDESDAEENELTQELTGKLADIEKDKKKVKRKLREKKKKIQRKIDMKMILPGDNLLDGIANDDELFRLSSIRDDRALKEIVENDEAPNIDIYEEEENEMEEERQREKLYIEDQLKRERHQVEEEGEDDEAIYLDTMEEMLDGMYQQYLEHQSTKKSNKSAKLKLSRQEKKRLKEEQLQKDLDLENLPSAKKQRLLNKATGALGSYTPKLSGDIFAEEEVIYLYAFLPFFPFYFNINIDS